MCKLLFGLFLTLINLNSLYGDRILAIIPTPSYSHQVAFHQVWKDLSLKGHHVTLLTTHPVKDASLRNLTEIDLHFTTELWKTTLPRLISIAQFNKIEFIQLFEKLTRDILKLQLNHSAVRDLIENHNDYKFDLVMAEIFHPATFAFAELYKCPLIGISSFDIFTSFYHAMGNPAHPILHPDMLYELVAPLNFMERLTSTFFWVFLRVYSQFFVMPEETRLIRSYFGDDFPALKTIGRRLSMLFLNTDPIFNGVRPLVPTIIQIGGGTHITQTKALPKDLLDILDNEEKGLIYFSLGTNVKTENVPEHTLKVITETFAEIPYKVLWKIDGEKLPNISANVITSSWFAQSDLLKHPNLKLFITQGGRQSLEEAIYSHTPMLGLPFFGDQIVNIQNLVRRNVALSLNYKTITTTTFKNAIGEMMENPKYRNQLKKLANLAQDQPMTGLERAIWWTEYVLRHKGATHLRSPEIDLPIYQYYFLDVIGFILITLFAIGYFLIKLIAIVSNYFKRFYVSPKVKML